MSERIVLEVPTLGDGGLDAERSGHFGQAESYTLVELTGGDLGEVSVIRNDEETHVCGAAAQMLAAGGATHVVVVGIGGRPMMALQQAGIEVYQDATMPTVREVVAAFLEGVVPTLSQSTCNHHH